MSDAYTSGPELIKIAPQQRKWYTLDEIAEAVAKLAIAKVEAAAKQK
jgi:hypothetical protein